MSKEDLISFLEETKKKENFNFSYTIENGLILDTTESKPITFDGVRITVFASPSVTRKQRGVKFSNSLLDEDIKQSISNCIGQLKMDLERP